MTTLGLLAFGTAAFAVIEWDGVFRGFSTVDKLTNAWFMSVTPRTAGFNTVSYAEVTNATAYLTLLLMFVGDVPARWPAG